MGHPDLIPFFVLSGRFGPVGVDIQFLEGRHVLLGVFRFQVGRNLQGERIRYRRSGGLLLLSVAHGGFDEIADGINNKDQDGHSENSHDRPF